MPVLVGVEHFPTDGDVTPENDGPFIVGVNMVWGHVNLLGYRVAGLPRVLLDTWFPLAEYQGKGKAQRAARAQPRTRGTRHH